MTQPLVTPNFGTCLATLFDAAGNLDLTPSMQLATGRDVLTQSLIRRQTTKRGSVITSPNDCFDVRDLISKEMTTPQLQALAASIKTELAKDHRVHTVQVNLTYNPSTNTCTIVESVLSSAGPFNLTLTLTAGNISAVVAGQ